MKRTQNEKILQIKNETLIVGVDIAKKIHHARAFDNRGVELGKLLKFENSAQGFAAFDAWLAKIQQKHGMTEAVVRFEPTGHYWFNLGDHLAECGHKLAILNPYHVKCARELDDNSPSKSDQKDPKTIAMLVKDGRYRDVYIPDGVYQELREMVRERERLQERLGSLSSQIIRWLDIYFPEFVTVFKDWRGKAAWIALRRFSTPKRMAEVGAQEILLAWREEMKRPSLKKAEALCSTAEQSIVFSVTIIVRVLLRVFDRITGLNPVQVESSSSSIRGGKGEALPGGQRAATLHQDKASIPNTTHYDRSMVRRFCQRVQS